MMKKKRSARSFFRYLMLKKRADVIFLLTIQVAVFFALAYFGSVYYVWLRELFAIISFALAIYLISERENPSYKILWLFLHMIFPVLSVVFYFVIHIQRKNRDKRHRMTERVCGQCEDNDAFSGDYTPIFNYLYRHGFSSYSNTEAIYFHSGEEMIDELVKAIKNAQRSIYLEYFIIEEGVVWNKILLALAEKARYGLDIRIIMDDMGCFGLHPKLYASQFLESGIKFLVFNPFRPFISSYHNNRNHRKFAVIDRTIAFTGGVNLADEYVNINSPYNYFKDCAIMLKGEASEGIESLFLSMWESAGGEKVNNDRSQERSEVVRYGQDGFFVPFSDFPSKDRHIGRDVYLEIISRAKKYVYISTPYLIPDDMIIEALELSAKSGIDVRIILPYEPDKKTVKATGVSYYKRLLTAGVRIFEYKAGFNHAKIIYSDSKVAVIGSTNLDYRSMYLNYEGGVFICYSSALQEINSDFLGMFELGKEIKTEDVPNGIFSKIYFGILRLFSPLM